MQIATKEMMTRRRGGGGRLQYLEWVQSDGRARVETGFVLPSITYYVEVVAAMTAVSNANKYFLCAGSPGYADSGVAGAGVGWCWFGKHSDRQHCIFFGRRRYWCASNAGNWAGTAMHSIGYSVRFGTTVSYKVDGAAVTFQNEGATSSLSADIGTAPMQVFGGGLQGVADNVRIRRVAVHSGSGSLTPLLCDFRAARIGRVAGLYDMVSGSFAQAVDGDLLCGGVVADPEQEI